MTTLTNIQFIVGEDGRPEYAVIPFKIFQTLCNHKVREFNEKETIPHEVIKKIHLEDMSSVQAWREHLNLTQAEVAEKMGISQAAYSQMEAAKKPRKATLQKIARAMNIEYEQLNV